MLVKFYGTRGSVPVCGPDFFEFGGNTTCLQVKAKQSDNIAIIDAGTGIRELGKDFIESGHTQEEIFVAFTHFHWDHIQGFPFFAPAFNEGQKINILALGWGKRLKCLEDIFKTQMQKRYFPVQLSRMGADFNFMLLKKTSKVFVTKDTNPRPVVVKTNKHNHPGGAFGYRIELDGKVMVFCTDIEHGDEISEDVVNFSKDADLLIHDAQFTDEELKEKSGWGHSSFSQAIEVAERANVKSLGLTHHDPDHDDSFLRQMEKKCQARFKDCFLAREKMEIEI
ncbi:MAG TPA: MBL fold metallo-hydrolase [Ignavibacteriaceae bacterium]|jgi:phosphoribosyl 1,2-cyclic phosphodiesterase